MEEFASILAEERVRALMEFPIQEMPVSLPNPRIRELIDEVSSVLGCRKDFLLIGLCMAVSAVIGKKISLKDRDYINYPSLWVVLVGTAGTNKTTPLQWALAPVEKLTVKYVEEYKEEKDAYDKRPDKNTPPPVCKELILKDTTHEKRLEALCDNDSLLQFNDEFAELIGSAERYTKNADMANWLSIFSNAMIKVSRKSNKTQICPKPSMSILGTTQPATLKELFSKKIYQRNGFIARFLFVVAPQNDKPLLYNRNMISEQTQSFWFQFIYNLDTLKESREIFLSDEARELYAAFYNYIEQMKNNSTRSFLLEYALKMHIHVLRYALLIQVIKDPNCKEVDGECMEYAIHTMSYFRYSAEYVYQLLAEKENKSISKTRIILSLVNDYKIPQNQVAKFFGVSRQNISDIIKRNK